MMVLDSPPGSMPVTPTRLAAARAFAGAKRGSDVRDEGLETTPKSQGLTSEPSLVVAPGANEPGLRAKLERASTLVASVFNKFYNGSSRAVDPFVIRCLQEEETRLFSLQCFIEQGPTERSRERKESVAMSSAMQATQPYGTLWNRLFGLCGGYMGGPGSVMREWDTISSHASGLDDAMRDYIAIVDKVLPGWDRPLPHEFPVAPQDKFWRDDQGALQCQSCGASFSSVQCRRHHCRLCFDIFCAMCCADAIDMALCPGAPIRRQRVCRACFEEADRERGLLEVRRMIRENHELEQKIKDVTATTEALVQAKQREEIKLRLEAEQSGCALDEIDEAIQKQIGSPVAVAVKLPPAHKFAPRESVDANDQLALAHRQLLMGLKVAQVRAKKAVETMDVTLRVLREAICFGAASTWLVVLRHTHAFLTLRELRGLLCVSHAVRTSLARVKCERKCVLAQDLPAPAWRAFVWQTQWLQDETTAQYLADLAEAVRARVESSDSESEDEESESNPGRRSTTRQAVVSHLVVGAHLAPSRRSVWKTVYEFILARCDDDASTSSASAGEFDAQIQGDVSRTFGVSSLRSRQSSKQKKNALVPRKAYQRAGASTLETPLALRKTALTNVLRAFASVNSGVGYCQGMDHVTALLLSVVDWNESDAFWMLTSLLASPQYELDKLYGPGLPHLNLRVFQLEHLLAVHLPTLHAHLQELDFPVSMLTTTWFMTLFTNMDALSYDLALRVLDGFFVSGWKLLFRVALAILDKLQPHMLASAFEEMPQVFYDIHTIAPELAGVDADVLLRHAARFKVTNGQLRELADEYDTLGHRATNGAVGGVIRRGSVAQSPTNASNGNGAGVAVGVAIIGSPKHANGSNGTATAPSANGTHNGTAHPSPSPSKATIANNTNGARSPAKRGSVIELATTTATQDEDHQSSQHHHHTPPPLMSRRSRNSSSASNSNESENGGRKSPDATRAASPPFLAPPQRYAMSSSSSLQYGLATPLNANYYF